MKKNLIIAAGIAALSVTACVSAVKHSEKTERNVAGISDIFRENMEKYSTNFGDQTPARSFTQNDVRKLAGADKLDLVDARLIIDNDASFDSKLSMIKRAKKEIRMVYFIYADDDSSSLLTQALINKAAKEDVQVKLLVDYITNYSKLDLFQMMVNEGRGNIKVHFYNFPSAQILRDAKYMTLPCPPAAAPAANHCAEFKAGLMKQLEPLETTPFSRLYLAGLYGKNPLALKVALGYGGGVDPGNLKKMKEETDEAEQDVIFDFFKLARKSMSGDIFTKLQLSSALASNGATLNPVLNELTGRLPLMSKAVNHESGVSHAAEWDHLTDYVHHKLLAIDGVEFQLGGRNVEDSYHMKSRLGSKGKYIFMDTDFWARTSAGGTKGIEATFDKLFNFDQMVASIEKVQRITPNEMIRNPEALMMATGACVQGMQQGKVEFSAMGSCVESNFTSMPSYKKQIARTTEAKKELADSVRNYETNYVKAGKKVIRDSWKSGADSLSKSDLANAEIYYLENVTYQKSADLKRRAGSRVGGEAKFNKNIHAAWYRGLENTCKVSRDEKREVRVVFHTAYLFMPSGMMHKLAKMMNGDYGDCSRVRVTFLTNSFETTDLNVINIFARYQMSELFKHYAGLTAYEQQFNQSNAGISRYTRFFPKLEYFEYNASSVGNGISLHTKLSILGDDMIVGSANADVRSYYMDTNNGVIIRKANDLNRDYLAFIDSIIGDSSKSSDMTRMFVGVSAEQMQDQNKMILAAMLKRWDKKGRVSAERQTQILGTIDSIGAKITNTTQRMLNFRGDFEQIQTGDGSRALSDIELELNNIANDFDDMFKVL